MNNESQDELLAQMRAGRRVFQIICEESVTALGIPYPETLSSAQAANRKTILEGLETDGLISLGNSISGFYTVL